jgi:hypothetical protein
MIRTRLALALVVALATGQALVWASANRFGASKAGAYGYDATQGITWFQPDFGANGGHYTVVEEP